MLYLVADVFGPATWIYVAEPLEQYQDLPPGERIEVRVALASYPDPVFPMRPREIAQRSHNVVRFTEMELGGHFPSYEAPASLVADLWAFAEQNRLICEKTRVAYPQRRPWLVRTAIEC